MLSPPGRAQISHMDGAFADRKRGFLDGFQRVGWAWQVRARSSPRAAELHDAGLMDQFPCFAADDVHTDTRSVFASAESTKPSVVWLTLERPLAVNGNLPTV